MRKWALWLLVVTFTPGGVVTAGQKSQATQPIERTAAGPGPDFPNLDSYYPAAARRAGQEGTATVKVCVDTAGLLIQPPKLVGTSGYGSIDTGALNLAAAASGHYRPAMENGVAVVGCGAFRVNFKLAADAVLPIDDTLFPIISARVRGLDAELTRRTLEMNKGLDVPQIQQILLSRGPLTEREIRRFTRTLDSFMDEYAGLAADFLEDVDYLTKGPGLPVGEQVVFTEQWADRRGAVAAQVRKVIGAMRDVVRSMDELGDYLAFSAPRRTPVDASASSENADDDPQVAAIRERARAALEKLQNVLGRIGETQRAAAQGSGEN